MGKRLYIAMHMLDLTVHVDLFRYYKTEKPVVVRMWEKILTHLTINVPVLVN